MCVCVCVYRFLNSAERALYIMIMFTLLGAWLGAVPIPLDWNRPWQVIIHVMLDHVYESMCVCVRERAGVCERRRVCVCVCVCLCTL